MIIKKVHQNPFTTNKTSSTVTQMYSQNLEQQRERLQYENPNTVRAMNIKSEMDELINLYRKMLKATDIVTCYQLLMAKKRKILIMK